MDSAQAGRPTPCTKAGVQSQAWVLLGPRESGRRCRGLAAPFMGPQGQEAGGVGKQESVQTNLSGEPGEVDVVGAGMRKRRGFSGSRAGGGQGECH